MSEERKLRLEITRGVPSATSLGYTGIADLPPVTISFMSQWLTLNDESGRASWIPAQATVKNGGIWLDSSVTPGRIPLATPASNVIETIRCLLKGNQKRKGETLSDLWQVAKAAQDYWTENSQSDPVYLTFEDPYGEGLKHALVYSIDLAVEYDPTYNPDDDAILTITLEREPAWRYTVPPGDNPRKYALESRGLYPGTAISSGYYDHTGLNLIPAIGNTYRGIVDGSIKNFDEFLLAGNNYLDVPANSIPGDAPAYALISWTAGLTAVVAKLHVARLTRRDLYPANNSNISTSRNKNTFNGGDATALTPTNITVSKPIVANGLISNGSAVNRHVLRLVYAAGAVNSQRICSFTKVINQYPGRYAVYLRAGVTAGTGTNVIFYVEYSYGSSNINLKFSSSSRLSSGATFSTTYLGIVDFTTLGNKLNAVDGRGVDSTTTFNLYLSSTKTTGDTPTIDVWDIVLMPIDEPNGIVTFDFATLQAGDPAFIDTTGYFNLRAQDVALSRQSSQNAPRQLNGVGIQLEPGINNRIYFMADTNAPIPSVLHDARIDIVPRTYGIRER